MIYVFKVIFIFLQCIINPFAPFMWVKGCFSFSTRYSRLSTLMRRMLIRNSVFVLIEIFGQHFEQISQRFENISILCILNYVHLEWKFSINYKLRIIHFSFHFHLWSRKMAECTVKTKSGTGTFVVFIIWNVAFYTIKLISSSDLCGQ